MKHTHLAKLIVCSLLTAFAVAGGLSSCGYEDDWYPVAPNGWNNTFYDRNLNGCWQLVQANSMPVSRFDTNYLEFYGNGRGRYYYYDHGQPYSERIAYWCQVSGLGTSRYQININYEYSSPVTMSYWFTAGNTLWLQWTTASGPVTYLYRAVNGVNW